VPLDHVDCGRTSRDIPRDHKVKVKCKHRYYGVSNDPTLPRHIERGGYVELARETPQSDLDDYLIVLCKHFQRWQTNCGTFSGLEWSYRYLPGTSGRGPLSKLQSSLPAGGETANISVTKSREAPGHCQARAFPLKLPYREDSLG